MENEELNARLKKLYNQAQLATAEGLTDEALAWCEEALALLDSIEEETVIHSPADFLMLMGDIHWTDGEFDDAFIYYSDVIARDPSRTDARIATGVALFHLCRFHSAQVYLEMASVESPDDAETWYYLGLLAIRRGKAELARIFFAMATELQEDRFFLPVEVEEEEILSIVRRQFDQIPKPLREVLKEIPIFLEPYPSEELLYSQDPPLDPLILGLFDGTPLPDQGGFSAPLGPTQIILFLENIRLVSQTREKLEEELWITLKHEIGHFLGLDEDDLAERGLA